MQHGPRPLRYHLWPGASVAYLLQGPTPPRQPHSLGLVLAQAGVCSGKAPAATHSQGHVTLQVCLLGGLPAGTELQGTGTPNKCKMLVFTWLLERVCAPRVRRVMGDSALCLPHRGEEGRHGGGTRCLEARATGPWAHLLGAGTAVALYWAQG